MNRKEFIQRTQQIVDRIYRDIDELASMEAENDDIHISTNIFIVMLQHRHQFGVEGAVDHGKCVKLCAAIGHESQVVGSLAAIMEEDENRKNLVMGAIMSNVSAKLVRRFTKGNDNEQNED
jgi:hypothetical protein